MGFKDTVARLRNTNVLHSTEIKQTTYCVIYYILYYICMYVATYVAAVL
jgi:hypothetical protein